MEEKYSLESIQNFKGKFPKQLYMLFFAEMWERFTFYGMRALLILFMTKQLLYADDVANLKYGAYNAFVYAMGIFGGMFADRFLGSRKAIRYGGILMAIGSFTLVLPYELSFYIGLGIIIVGNGFFKPNISTMVGQLYKPGDPRRDAGFSLFYSGINFGAFFGSLICGWVGEMYSWHLGFGLAGAFMLLGLVVFFRGQHIMGPIGLPPNPEELKKKYFLGLNTEQFIYVACLGLIPIFCLLLIDHSIVDYIMIPLVPLSIIVIFWLAKDESKVAIQKLVTAMVLILFSMLFWAFYEQGGGSLNLFADRNVDMNVFGFELSAAAVNNSVNPFYIIIFSPLIGLLWVLLAKKKLEPNIPVKFAIGLALLGVGFLVFGYSKNLASTEGLVPLWIFISAYFIITMGELCVSPIGLSMVTKLSPGKIVGLMMGMWFLASAFGQYLAGWIGAAISKGNEGGTGDMKDPVYALSAFTDTYGQIGYVAIGSGILLLILSPALKKLMHGIH